MFWPIFISAVSFWTVALGAGIYWGRRYVKAIELRTQQDARVAALERRLNALEAAASPPLALRPPVTPVVRPPTDVERCSSRGAISSRVRLAHFSLGAS